MKTNIHELKIGRSSPTTPIKPILYAVNPGGCWEVVSHVAGKNGYVHVSIKKKAKILHRLAWIAYRGEIPGGMFVCHRCDNKLCVNPEHLFLGTALDNMRDKMAKNRHVAVKGEDHGMAKLTIDQVIEIRKLKGRLYQKEIAKRFNVSKALISLIHANKNWNFKGAQVE